MSGSAARAVLNFVNQLFWKHTPVKCKQATNHPDRNGARFDIRCRVQVPLRRAARGLQRIPSTLLKKGQKDLHYIFNQATGRRARARIHLNGFARAKHFQSYLWLLIRSRLDLGCGGKRKKIFPTLPGPILKIFWNSISIC